MGIKDVVYVIDKVQGVDIYNMSNEELIRYRDGLVVILEEKYKNEPIEGEIGRIDLDDIEF